MRDIDEPKVVPTGMRAQPRERLVHAEALPFSDHAFGLFDNDAAVERVVELIVDDVGL